MPRGKKKTDEVAYTTTPDATKMSSTEGAKMRVYTSKPQKKETKKLAKPGKETKPIASEEPKRVNYELSDTEHPITSVSTFIHATLYWIPNSDQFVVENPSRGEGKSIIAAPTFIFTSDQTDFEAVNAVMGMHFDENSKSMFESIRSSITQDSTNIRVFHVCELGLVRDKKDTQYGYITY